MPHLFVGDREVEYELLIFDKDGTLMEQRPVLFYLAKGRFPSLTRLIPPYGVNLLPGALETLQKLKAQSFKIALATIDSHKRAEESLNKFKISSYFDVVLGVDDVERGKLAPDMILKACKLTNCSPRDSVVIGDSCTDMLMGKNARVKTCIGVLSGSTSKKELERVADIVVPSVASLRVMKWQFLFIVLPPL